jgi:lipopolysaccharide/colanic/teichoic acid biosynthesis glycosyltransferase
MIKRLFDFTAASVGLVLLSPLTIPVAVAIWAQDFHSPFYTAPRVGLNGRMFYMIKFRSMVINADKNKVDSTSSSDVRITPIGKFVRRLKVDEIPQLWNVIKGDMSLVGPRPNVERETDLYTDVEKGLLRVRPGITDLASIVFADEGDILEAAGGDPNIAYNQLIRPWKSRLSLFAIEHRSLLFDLKLIGLTMLAVTNRPRTLAVTAAAVERLGAGPELVAVTSRSASLRPTPPPGSDTIVAARV